MSVDVATPPPPSSEAQNKEEQPYIEVRKKRHTGWKLLGILVVWLALYQAFKGKMTRYLPIQDTNELHNKLNDARDWVQLHGEDNWFIGGVLGTIGDFLNWAVTQLQELISIPAFPRPVPEIGWIGVVTADTVELRAIQMPIGIPISIENNTDSPVMISESMLSGHRPTMPKNRNDSVTRIVDRSPATT